MEAFLVICKYCGLLIGNMVAVLPSYNFGSNRLEWQHLILWVPGSHLYLGYSVFIFVDTEYSLYRLSNKIEFSFN